MKKILFVVFCLGVVTCLSAEETICSLVADNSIAAHGSELKENAGKSPRIKIKGSENYPIMKFDLSKIPNTAKVVKAELVVEVTDPKMKLRQIGYSSVPVDWVEGEGAKPDTSGHGFSCYLGAQGPGSSWGKPGYRFLDSVGGNVGTISGAVLAVAKENNQYMIELPGRLISAMQKDQVGGLMILDETGWWGGEYSNIYLHSRESKGKGAQLKVTWEESTDKTAPSVPGIRQSVEPLESGDVMLVITCGSNDDQKGMALGFDMRIAEGAGFDWETAKPLHRMDIPRPQEAGKELRHLLSGLKPGSQQTIGIRAYDESGNTSAVQKVTVTVMQIDAIPEPKPDMFTYESGSPLVSEGLLNIWGADEMSKINPIDGTILVNTKFESADYKNGNLFWNGKEKAVTIRGGKGEFVSFHLVLENISGQPINALSFQAGDFKSNGQTIAASNVRFLRKWYLKHENNWYSHAMPLLADKNKGVLALPYTDNVIPDQKVMALYVELFVPYDAKAGAYEGSVVVSADGKTINVPIKANILDYEIPRELSFIIELNAYGSGKSQERFFGIHRLAHMYRTGYNVLGYGHSGGSSVPYIPKVEGMGKDAKIADWSEWDKWMGPLLSGELFKDMPRGAVPIPHQYMPFYENYPMPVTEYLGGKIHSKRKELKDDKAFMPFMCANDVLIEDGFSQTWHDGVFAIGQEYRKHFEEKGWTKTQFQLFCNNKVFKGKENATSLWTLDEPTYGRDFRALGYLSKEFLKPFAGTTLEMTTRGDVSRPSAQGNRLDDALGVTVMSGGFYSNYRFISKRMKERGEKYWVYGGSIGTNKDSAQLLAVYIKMWRLGCVGGLVYWTSFAGASWDELNELAIVLKGEHGYADKPTASENLATQRRAQQDIELMTLLSKKKGWNHQMVSKYVDTVVSLASSTQSKNAEDPGKIQFSAVDVTKLTKLRYCIQEELLKK